MKKNQKSHGERWGLYSSELKQIVVAYLDSQDLEVFYEPDMGYYNLTAIAEDAINNIDIPKQEKESVHHIVSDYCQEMSLSTY